MQDICESAQAFPADQSVIAHDGVPSLSRPTALRALSSEPNLSPPATRLASANAKNETDDQSLRILLADDHAIVRKGLKRILSSEFHDAIFGEAANANQVLEAVLREPWDLVLLDLTMPGRNGADALTQILRARPKLPVLICSMHPEEHYAMALIKAGAAGYITKDTGTKGIIEAVKKVLAGGRHISPSLMESLVENLSHPVPPRLHDKLSARERQVMLLLASGQTVKEIAFELGLSPKTVSTFRFRLLKKMSLTTNGAIIRYALLHKLIA